MLGKKHLEALKKQTKRRTQRPLAKATPPATLKASSGLENRMMRQYQDVLQNVEFGLVTAYREWDEVDDRVVDRALQATILKTQAADPLAQRIVDLLDEVRSQREDVADDVWRDAMRVVLNSARRHSACRAGDTNYLDFAARFIL
jgi:hypothetical protein